MDFRELIKLPPSVLRERPAQDPPPGTQSNLVDPYNRGPQMAVAATIIVALALICYAMRMYSKTSIIRRFSVDDWTLSMSLPLIIPVYVAYVWCSVRGPMGKHMWDVSAEQIFLGKDWLIPQYISISMTQPSLGLVKVTIILFYLQVFWPLRWMRICAYTGATFTAAFYLAMTIVQFYFGTPSPKETWAEHQASPDYGRRQQKVAVSIPAVGLVIDVFLLVLPFPAILQLQIQKKRKIGVLLIFAVGLLACIASALNVYYRSIQHSMLVRPSTLDLTWINEDINLLSLVETLVGIIIACMPGVANVLSHHLPSLQSRLDIQVAAFREKYFKNGSMLPLSDPPDTPSKPSSHGNPGNYVDREFELNGVARPNPAAIQQGAHQSRGQGQAVGDGTLWLTGTTNSGRSGLV